MIKRLSVCIFLFFSLILFSQNNQDIVLGNWLASDNSVAVEVFRTGAKYRAKVIWFNEKMGSGAPMHERIDTENPNPKLRNRKILGMEVLEGLEYNEKSNSWENGKIYDATTGRDWDSSATMSGELLKVRGFWKFRWIGKSMTFKKIKEPTFTKK